MHKLHQIFRKFCCPFHLVKVSPKARDQTFGPILLRENYFRASWLCSTQSGIITAIDDGGFYKIVTPRNIRWARFISAVHPTNLSIFLPHTEYWKVHIREPACRTNLMTNVLWLHPSRYRMNYVTMVFKISQKLCIYRRQIQHGGFQLNSNSSENIPRKPVSRCVLPQYPNFTILDAVTWHGFQFLYGLQLFFYIYQHNSNTPWWAGASAKGQGKSPVIYARAK